MEILQNPGKMIAILGIFLFILGTIISLLERFPFLGKLPGDIFIRSDKFSFFMPITTSILISLIISAIITIFLNIKK